MAVTIRTGANGSYKSAYSAYFVILKALKAGRIVVTNFEGMQPLKSIEKRLNITFPSTARLLRISSRDESGIHLWSHFFCWMPIGTQIVIDECQDIFSTKVGFDIKKVKYLPLNTFISKDDKDGLLPPEFIDLFNSRYVPADMTKLAESETDDRGIAEYDEQGRPIYPHNFNEGFMRHRKYDWDIELLSPDWTQIDTGIKMCAEQCFFHKQRDQYPWTKRKPYIFKHEKSSSKPTIPKGYNVNLTTEKIPLDSFLLYKSTATGSVKNAGAMNTLFRSPKLIAVTFLFISCVGYLIYALSNMVSDSGESLQESSTETIQIQLADKNGNAQGVQVPNVLSNGRNSNQADNGGIQDFSPRLDVGSLFPFKGFKNVYYTGHVVKADLKNSQISLTVSLEVDSDDGTYFVNDRYLNHKGIKYKYIDECMLELTYNGISELVVCRPKGQAVQLSQTSLENPQVSLF